MATKKSSSTPSRSHMLSTLAFIAIVISAIIWAVSITLQMLNRWTGLSLNLRILGILNAVAIALMSIVTLFVAYNYVRNRKNIVYHVVFWVCAVIVLVVNILVVFI